MQTTKSIVETPRATRREWIGLAVLAIACVLYAMDLTVLHLAVSSVPLPSESPQRWPRFRPPRRCSSPPAPEPAWVVLFSKGYNLGVPISLQFRQHPRVGTG